MTITKYDIAEHVMATGLEGFSGTMLAAQQRRIFGAYLFGRKTFAIDCDGQGRVHGTYSCAFGTDSAFFNKSFGQIAEAANDGTPLGF